MSTLGRPAREALRDAGVPVNDFIGEWFGGTTWGGDRCGCPDDRCIGYHHDEGEEPCGCFWSVLGDSVK